MLILPDPSPAHGWWWGKHEGKQIVLAHGVFDCLHVGHCRYLRAARALGDVLVVTITPDEHVGKGPGRPVFPAEVRAEVLAALSCVSLVAVNRWPTAVEVIRLLKPHVYAKGADAAGSERLEEERRAVEECGGRVVLIEGEKFSSTALVPFLQGAIPTSQS